MGKPDGATVRSVNAEVESRHGCVWSVETCLLSSVVLYLSLLCSVTRNYAEYVESLFHSLGR